MKPLARQPQTRLWTYLWLWQPRCVSLRAVHFADLLSVYALRFAACSASHHIVCVCTCSRVGSSLQLSPTRIKKRLVRSIVMSKSLLAVPEYVFGVRLLIAAPLSRCAADSFGRYRSQYCFVCLGWNFGSIRISGWIFLHLKLGDVWHRLVLSSHQSPARRYYGSYLGPCRVSAGAIAQCCPGSCPHCNCSLVNFRLWVEEFQSCSVAQKRTGFGRVP